jgi:hypothetical protein
MTQEETHNHACEAKFNTTRKKYLLLLTLGTVIAFLLLCNSYRQPPARINRVLSGFGLGRLPDSAENLIIERKKGDFLGTQVILIGFNASETDIFNFLNSSLGGTADEPGSLASFHLGPELSSWMKWDVTANGRVYHLDRTNTSIWLVVDDESNAIYLFLFLHSPEWLCKFRKYLL